MVNFNFMVTLNCAHGDEYHSTGDECMFVCVPVVERTFFQSHVFVNVRDHSERTCLLSFISLCLCAVHPNGWPGSRLSNVSASLESCASDQSMCVSEGSDAILIRYDVKMLYRSAQNAS